jgi:hypothetical protein
MINEEVRFRRYKVRMHGSSMSASYTGTVDVWASDTTTPSNARTTSC